jgi:hypothetical protein
MLFLKKGSGKRKRLRKTGTGLEQAKSEDSKLKGCGLKTQRCILDAMFAKLAINSEKRDITILNTKTNCFFF